VTGRRAAGSGPGGGVNAATTNWWGQRRVARGRAGRRAVAAVVVGLCLAVAAGPAGAAGPIGAAVPEPDATIQLVPGGVEHPFPVLIGDDAVYYAVQDEVGRSAVYTRSLTRDVSGTEVGPATFVGRTFWDTQLAEHDGTLAYVRSLGNQLVLRAPDGTETLPEWGDDPRLAGGVAALTDDWLLGIDYPYEPSYTLFDRQTGVAHDLADLITLPAPFTWKADYGTTLTDDRAVFGVYSEEDPGGAYTGFHGLYTVALGPDGPTGPVTTLEEEIYDAGTTTGSSFGVVGIEGTRVVWNVATCVRADCASTLRWRDAAPYDGTPSEAPLGDAWPRFLDDGTVVAVTPNTYPAESVDWLSLDDPSTPVRSLQLPYGLDTVHGDLFVSRDGATSVLIDADGDPVTGDQTPVADPFPFRDVPFAWDDLFADQIMWLYDRGVVGGYADGTFRHLAPVNRDAMAAFLFRMALPGVGTTDCPSAAFSDVAATHPFCAEISWLSETGITTGFPDGSFRPGTPVSREAMAAFLYRLAHDGADAPACTNAPFADVAVGNPFCGEIAWLASTGVTTGWPDGSFRPGASIERQAMAAFLFRAIDTGLLGPEAPAAA